MKYGKSLSKICTVGLLIIALAFAPAAGVYAYPDGTADTHAVNVTGSAVVQQPQDAEAEKEDTAVISEEDVVGLPAEDETVEDGIENVGSKDIVTDTTAVAGSSGERKPFNIILSFTGDTSTTMTFSWFSESSSPAYVRYGKTEDLAGKASILLNDEQFEEADVSDESTSKAAGSEKALLAEAKADFLMLGENKFKFEVTASDLSPGTKYSYAVGNSTDGWSDVLEFTTADSESDEVLFMYMGDSQFTDDMESDNTAWGQLVDSACSLNPDLNFVITGGDMVNNGSLLTQWESILSKTDAFSRTPLMTTVGNHECFNYYKEPFLYRKIMALPENGPSGYKEDFYSYDYANTHVTVLNSCVYWEDGLLGDFIRKIDHDAIASWIRRDLTQTSARHKVVVLHHPPYSVFDDEACDNIRENWVPIFEECGVELVFTGHQHIFTRSYPLYEGQIDFVNGITYVMGFSGNKTYQAVNKIYNEKEIGYISTYQIVYLKGDGVRVVTFDAKGNELDKYTRTSGYYDVSPGNWFAQYVTKVTENEIFGGMEDHKFEPNKTMNRAMVASALARLDGADTTGYDNPFADVGDNRWFRDDVSWAQAKGIISGAHVEKDTGDEYIFRPEDPVTREELAVILYNYAKYKGNTSKDILQLSNISFPDNEDIASWSSEAVTWCTSHKIINGNDEGYFNPKAVAKRVDVAVIISNYIDRYK